MKRALILTRDINGGCAPQESFKKKETSEFEVSVVCVSTDEKGTADIHIPVASTNFDLLVLWHVMPSMDALHAVCSWNIGVFCPQEKHYHKHGGLYDPRWADYVDFRILCASHDMLRDAERAGFDACEIGEENDGQLLPDLQLLSKCSQPVNPNRDKLLRCSRSHGWAEWPIHEQPIPDVQALKALTTTKQPTEACDQDARPDVTVVTVIFNIIKEGRREAFIKCMDSVQEQEGTGVEHVIVDGASTDETLSLIRDYSNRRHPIRYLSMKDDGIYDAMNRGLAMARGEYVVFLNSDDFYHNPEGMKESVACLRATQCDFSFAPITTNPTSHPHNYPEDLLSTCLIGQPFSHQSLLVKRTVMQQLHGFDLSFQSAADFDFILRMLKDGHRGCYVPCNFVTFSLGGISITNAEQSMREVGIILQRFYNKHCRTKFTAADCYRAYADNRLPDDKRVMKLQRRIAKKSFVNVPDPYSQPYSIMPDVRAVLQDILGLHFRHFFHMMLINFNSRFDRRWYLWKYEDVRAANFSPAAHYLDHGWLEGRDPSKRFSTKRYLKKNPDVANMNMCPLLHWKLIGKKEHRSLE